jgi:excisionase family DNA binding protein
MEHFYSTSEVAERLGLHRTTILRLVDSGKLEAKVYRYGPRATIRIPERAVEAFIERWNRPDGEDPQDLR